MADKKKNTLEKVKRDFLRITSPCGYGGEGSRFDNILSVNVPPLLGCADAAFEVSKEILQKNLTQRARGTGSADPFLQMRTLLQDARNAADEAGRYAEADKQIVPVQPFLTNVRQILDVLDMLILISAPPSRGKESRKTAGSSGAARGKSVLFFNEEEKLRQILLTLMEETTSVLQSCQEKFQTALSESDAERYTKACTEYTTFYRKLAKI